MPALDRTESDVSYTDERSTARKIFDRVRGYGRDTGGLKVNWSDREKYENPKAYKDYVKKEKQEPLRTGADKVSGLVAAKAAAAKPAAANLAAVAKPAAVNPLAGYAKSAADYNVAAPTLKVDPITGQVISVDQQSLAQQQAALGLIQQAAQGNAPSAAQAQMQSGLNAAIQAQMAMARSGRGGYNPAAIRGAMQSGAQAQQENILQQSALRAQEMAGARGQYGDLASTIAAQRAQQAQAQAQLSQAADIQNQQMSYQTGSANAANTLQAQQQTLAGKLGYSQLAEGGLNREAQVKQAQAQIAMAKSQLAAARTEADRRYWLDVIGKATDVVSSGIGSYFGMGK